MCFFFFYFLYTYAVSYCHQVYSFSTIYTEPQKIGIRGKVFFKFKVSFCMRVVLLVLLVVLLFGKYLLAGGLFMLCICFFVLVDFVRNICFHNYASMHFEIAIGCVNIASHFTFVAFILGNDPEIEVCGAETD